MSEPLAVAMNRACEEDDLSQREFIEDALRVELETPSTFMAVNLDDPVYRTGMWIDPLIMRLLDSQIDRERQQYGKRATQRAVIERAVRRKLASR
jgi:hypothetical protein